jgi:2-enoate reductase
MDGPQYMGRLGELADGVHHQGGKLCIQLTPGFGRVNFVQDNPIQPIGPSENPCFLDPSVSTRAMTIDEIQHLVARFGEAAGRVKVCGADAVNFQGYGGYLIDQFMTPLWNRRTDEYGGSFENRMRFALELIAATRAAVGPDFPLIFKMTADHWIEGGRKLEEGLEIARCLVDAGIDALHVDGGCYEVWHKVIPPMYESPGTQVYLAEAVRKAVDVPVLIQGKLGDPARAEQIVAEGQADIIILGRPLLADPEWVNKVKAGRAEDIRPCIGCNDGCIYRGYNMQYLSCAVNPECGMEREFFLTPIAKKKSVLVIGGGPGGMEAAARAAQRGCEVTLWEKAEKLGGKLRTASLPEFKRDIRPLITYLEREVEKAGVKLELGKEATEDSVAAVSPDVAIVAVGSVPARPPVPGIASEHVISYVDAIDTKEKCGQRVLVVGGGLCGCETAVFLAQQGKTVTLIEMMEQIIPEGTSVTTLMGISELLAKSGVSIKTGTKLVGVTTRGARLAANGSEQEIEVDTVVIASGFAPNLELRNRLEQSVPEVHTVGDCAKSRNILNAVWEGYHAARLL